MPAPEFDGLGGLPSSRRQSPRLEIYGQLRLQEISTGALLDAYDLSAGGFSFHAPAPYTSGTIEDFQFTTTLGHSVVLRAKSTNCRLVIRDSKAIYLTGWQFVTDEDPTANAAIDLLLDALTSSLSFD